MKVKLLSHALLFATPWIVACTKLLRPWDFQGKSTGMGCHFLLQGIFPIEGSNPGLSHCRQTLYRLSHQGSHISRTDPKSIKEIEFIVKIFEFLSTFKGEIMLISHELFQKIEAIGALLIVHDWTCILPYVCAKSLQSCPTLGDPGL